MWFTVVNYEKYLSTPYPYASFEIKFPASLSQYFNGLLALGFHFHSQWEKLLRILIKINAKIRLPKS